jgi:hypothetical protein
MERFDLQPVMHHTLPEVAAFLCRWRCSDAENSPAEQPVCEPADSIERRLRWLLLDNPVAVKDGTLGYCLRDGLGVIRGLNLCYPSAFVSADQGLMGLCAGSFFVEQAARSMGFYLFKKYLNTPGYSFYYSSTCNGNSSELWKSMGGCAVPHSETEFILPLRLDAVMPAYVAARTSSKAAASIARTCGRGVNPILRFLTRPSAKLAIEQSHDWQKLADLARRHRSADHITSDRSPALLQWRYGPDSPSHPCSVYLFRDEQGNEGWFALGELSHGDGGKIREAVLLDAIWAQEKTSYRSIFQHIVSVAAASADVILFRWQPGLDYSEYSRFMIAHKLAAPRAYVSVPKRAQGFPLDLLDYDDSDYIAWRFQWSGSEKMKERALNTNGV